MISESTCDTLSLREAKGKLIPLPFFHYIHDFLNITRSLLKMSSKKKTRAINHEHGQLLFTDLMCSNKRA